MPSDIEQLSGLPKSSEVVRNVDSIAKRRGVGIAQWLVSFSEHPCGLRDFALARMIAGHEPCEILGEVRAVAEARVCGVQPFVSLR